MLSIGGIGILIFFIHHIASSIQASRIIASVADETMMAVDRLFRRKLDKGSVDDDEDHHFSRCLSGPGRQSRLGAMVTSKAWITRRSCAWRGSTRLSCSTRLS